MNKYELAVVVSAKLEDDARAEVVEKVKALITRFGCGMSTQGFNHGYQLIIPIKCAHLQIFRNVFQSAETAYNYKTGQGRHLQRDKRSGLKALPWRARRTARRDETKLQANFANLGGQILHPSVKVHVGWTVPLQGCIKIRGRKSGVAKHMEIHVWKAPRQCGQDILPLFRGCPAHNAHLPQRTPRNTILKS